MKINNFRGDLSDISALKNHCLALFNVCRLATNMVIYLTEQMGLTAGAAGMQVSLFEGTCYMTPLLGAWLADTHWGRFNTILAFSGIYALVCPYTPRDATSDFVLKIK